MAIGAQVAVMRHRHVRQAVLDGRYLSIARVAQVGRTLVPSHVGALHSWADHVPCAQATAFRDLCMYRSHPGAQFAELQPRCRTRAYMQTTTLELLSVGAAGIVYHRQKGVAASEC